MYEDIPSTQHINEDLPILVCGSETGGRIHCATPRDIFPSQLTLRAKPSPEAPPFPLSIQLIKDHVPLEAHRPSLDNMCVSIALEYAGEGSYTYHDQEQSTYFEASEIPGTAFWFDIKEEQCIYTKPFAYEKTQNIWEEHQLLLNDKILRAPPGVSDTRIFHPFGGCFFAYDPLHCTQNYYEILEDTPNGGTRVTGVKYTDELILSEGGIMPHKNVPPDILFYPMPTLEESLSLEDCLCAGYASINVHYEKLQCTFHSVGATSPPGAAHIDIHFAPQLYSSGE